MKHFNEYTWVQARKGKWIKVKQPSLSEILEALETMTQPLSSPTDTTGAASFWTFEEHERFVQGLRLHPDGSYEQIADHIGTKYVSEVVNYAMECWKSCKYQQITPVKKHRVRKWLKASLKWCVEALSFHCLRRQERTTYTAADYSPELGSVSFPASVEANRENKAPTQASTPEPVYSDINIEAAVYSMGAAFLRRDQTDSELEVDSNAKFFGYAPPSKKGSLFKKRIGSIQLFERRGVVTRDASTLETSPETLKKQGPWSSDEHQRYCEGLENYRYGSWKLIADHVGTRTERQVMSHAQSIRAKRKRAEDREKHGQQGHISSKLPASRKNARTRTSTVSTPTAIGYSNTQVTLVEVLLASLDNPYLEASNSSPTNEASSTTTVGYSDAVADDLSPTLAGVLSFELSTDQCELPGIIERNQDDHYQVPLISEGCLDILVENVVCDEELFELLDNTSVLSEVPNAT
ncbi:hypothetical protein F443_06000 [Phytophthora nicotianae P1569]|uniref:HTH myb-type domain-containing protein n=1 Tax=Phytophthora nicotianae P1569 TaxID=1317065 RepID=V9FI82_PHYNI|nr:hypothetical protein F443_06000 [Phytophthora nicotianae P1569]